MIKYVSSIGNSTLTPWVVSNLLSLAHQFYVFTASASQLWDKGGSSLDPSRQVMHQWLKHSGSDQSVSIKELLAATGVVKKWRRWQNEATVRLKTSTAAPEEVSVDAAAASVIWTGEDFFIERRAKNRTEGFSRWKRCFSPDWLRQEFIWFVDLIGWS